MKSQIFLVEAQTHFTFRQQYLEGAITQSKVTFSAFPPLHIMQPECRHALPEKTVNSLN